MSGEVACLPSSWPDSAACGHGHCVNGTCVCDKGYQREGFLILTDSCLLHTETIVLFSTVQAIVSTFSALVGLYMLLLSCWAYTKDDWRDSTQQRILQIRLLFIICLCGWIMISIRTANNPRKSLPGHDLGVSILWLFSYTTAHCGGACTTRHHAIFCNKQRDSAKMQPMQLESMPVRKSFISYHQMQKLAPSGFCFVMFLSALPVVASALLPSFGSEFLTVHLLLAEFGIMCIGYVLLFDIVYTLETVNEFIATSRNMKNAHTHSCHGARAQDLSLKQSLRLRSRLIFSKGELLRQVCVNIAAGLTFCVVPYLRQITIYFEFLVWTLYPILPLLFNVLHSPRPQAVKRRRKRGMTKVSSVDKSWIPSSVLASSNAKP